MVTSVVHHRLFLTYANHNFNDVATLFGSGSDNYRLALNGQRPDS